ncbi:IclR family transcriptional regulator [Microbacterium sp.]|uniref:IclR family transcriptional regulator n=1 Tax=Microbacterium sp. TaxID=51671 RepID=UPI0039E5AB64
MSSQGEQTLIGSVQRALSLVDIVANSARPVPVKSLAVSSGLTSGTTYNLVRTLVHEGYLRTEPDGVVLGARFPGFSAPAGGAGMFVSRVRESLNTVTELTGVAAYLSRFTDGEVHLVDIVDAVENPRVELWVGLHDSAHATALGKRILADLPVAERLDYLSRHPLGELTPHTISDRRTLLAQLEHGPGWSIDREEYVMGHTCIAVPVIAPGITASLAVSIPHGQGLLTPEQAARQLRGVAGRLALQLGADRL